MEKNKTDSGTTRILLIDEINTNGAKFRELVSQTNLSVELDMAENLADAKKYIDSGFYDCIFINFDFPREEGMSIIRLAKTDGLTNIPVVIITEKDIEQAAFQAIKSGAFYCLSRTNLSSNTIESVIRVAQSESRQVTQNNEGVSILIVDDDDTDRMALRRSLSKTTYPLHFEEADTGERGLNLLKRKRFQYVLLDYNLPGISGIQFIESMWRDDFHNPIIIMVSSKGNENVALEAIRKGAADYLSKDEVSAERMEILLQSSFRLAITQSSVVGYMKEIENLNQHVLNLEKGITDIREELNALCVKTGQPLRY